MAAEAAEGGAAQALESRPVVISAGEVRNSDTALSLRASGDRSKEGSAKLMEWLISPVPLEQFYSEIWEKKPLLIRRPNARQYYDGWFGKRDVEELLEKRCLHYGTNMDITKYVDGGRMTFNEDGIAEPSAAWRRYGDGCSLRILHPQHWSDTLWWLLTTLERHWQQLAGCNVYLTPPHSQGFSPHYDDIDAYILQVEGSKRWRLYPAPSDVDVLPRFSSPDFAQDAIGDPILDVVLHPGDLLYLPRGVIHQAECSQTEHSLHLTISTGQRNTWADFLSLSLPRAIELAAEEHVELRRSLPRDVLDFMGVAHSDNDSDPRRQIFLSVLTSCLLKVAESGPWDSAVDQLAGTFMRHRLPPFPAEDNRGPSDAESAEVAAPAGRGPKRRRGGGRRAKGERLSLESLLTVAVEGGCRVIAEDDSAVVYHMMDNSQTGHNDGTSSGLGEGEDGAGRIEFSLECAHWLEVLTGLSATTPTSIGDIVQQCNPSESAHEDEDAVLSIVQSLLDHRVLMLCPNSSSSVTPS